MKLRKAKLIKSVKTSLEKLGFTEFKDTISGFQGFFSKRLNNGFYLTLGLTIHRYYDSMFTADFYLSKTTRLASVWGDIPLESDERPGVFLTKEERKLYLDEEHNAEGVVDVWWDGNHEKEVENFLRVIELTEQRFINQPELLKNIEDSKEIQELAALSDKTKKGVMLNQRDLSFKFQPEKEIDGIPFIWFKAAETVLKETGGILNTNTVKLLAADAFRQNEMSTK